MGHPAAPLFKRVIHVCPVPMFHVVQHLFYIWLIHQNPGRLIPCHHAWSLVEKGTAQSFQTLIIPIMKLRQIAEYIAHPGGRHSKPGIHPCNMPVQQTDNLFPPGLPLLLLPEKTQENQHGIRIPPICAVAL